MEQKVGYEMDELDQHLQNFVNGNELHLQDYLGCHADGNGYTFRVWAPHAQQVWLVGDFNNWDKSLPMSKDAYGVWSAYSDQAQVGQLYKFLVKQASGKEIMKIDPLALEFEKRPGNAAVIVNHEPKHWTDGAWFGWHKRSNHFARPINIYEVHVNSWKQHEDGSLYTLKDLQKELIPYVKEQGFNYIEFLPLTAHPLDASWGYQTIGYFALEHAYGQPRDLQDFVEACHKENIGVLTDWVPGHFCINNDALAYYDGTPTYEFSEKWRAENKGWGALNFDLGKPQVQSFLLSSALFWLDYYHLDGLRVDAVSNMLYRDYDRGPGEWTPDQYGGNRNIEGIEFLHKFNTTLKGIHPERLLIAEESSAQVKITGRVEDGGLGFDYKWNMGWMNDTLKYIKEDPLYRHWLHVKLTHTADYAFTENYVLVLSHDEVVHLKKPMLGKAPGGIEDQLATLKTLYAFQFTHPGKKLLFMGQDFAEDREWDEKREINWALADDFGHRDVMQCVRNLIGIYKMYPCLHSDSRDPVTFEWVNSTDSDRNIISFIRRNPWNYDGAVLVVCSFSPVQYNGYRCGVPEAGLYKRMFSTYDSLPGSGGPGERDIPPLTAQHSECDGREYSISYDLRPFESVIIELPRNAK